MASKKSKKGNASDSGASTEKMTSKKEQSDLGKKMTATKQANIEKFGKPKTRTDKELAEGTKKEKAFLVIRKAYNLGKKNKFSGTKLGDMKSPNGAFYSASKQSYSGKSAPYWREDNDAVEDVIQKARNAQEDVANQEYSGNVKDLLDAFVTLGGGSGSTGERGPRQLNTTVVKSLSF